jgi:hypothetical protein
MVFHLKGGNRVRVLASGRIDYLSVTGRVYRDRGRTGWTFQDSVEFVRNSAWGPEVRYVTEQ